MTRNNGRGGLHWIVLAVLLAGGCAGMLPVEPLPDQYYFWQVHSPDRSDADRVIDQRRQPEKLLSFYAVRPGMRVLDLGAGNGWPGVHIAVDARCRVTLADIPRPALLSAAARAKRARVSRRCDAVLASAVALPFRPASFDAIVHTDVMC